jgi:type IV pilus assembly protein PilV
VLNREARAPWVAAGETGVGLIEILITIVLISFGLLGLAGVQGKMTQAQFELLQRAQALTLVADISQRMQANPSDGAKYVTETPLGTGDTIDCAIQATPDKVDRCAWSAALKGSAEQLVSVSASVSVGGLVDARGCVELLQASEIAVCKPAIYRASVVWQGLVSTVAPAVACGAGLYGQDETQRRLVSLQVIAPLLSC